MGSLSMANHLLGFAAPALVVGLLVALGARLFASKSSMSWWWQAGLNAVAGTAVLVAGLWFFGVDGKMAAYAGLVVAVATSQWLGGRGWRT
jgi:hypothetical protein